MPKEEFLSAVARRRLLNGSISSTTSTPNSTSQSQSPSRISAELAAQRPKQYSSVNVNDAQAHGNSFDALVSEDIVQFSNSREVESLDDLTLRIRLSRGQRCIISGRYTLWVKDGTVEILGARLEASTKVYHVYSMTTNEVPELVARSKSVEMEICSCNDDDLPWTGSKSFESILQSSKNAHVTSFLVHGYSTSEDDVGTTVAKPFDGGIFSNIARQLGQLELDGATALGPAILLCGKNLAGSSATFMCMLNSIITSKAQNKRHTSERGILVLDLDVTAPAFSSAGTATLAHVVEPLLGPSWCFPATVASATGSGAVRVLKMLYVRDEDAWESQSQFDPLIEHLQSVRQKRYRGCPVIIKACSLLDGMDSEKALKLAKQLAPNFVICYGAERGPIDMQIGSLVVSECNISPPLIVPTSITKEYPLPIQHELMLQSYCHLKRYHFGQPVWSHLPLELDWNCRVWLRVCGESASGLQILIPEMHLHTDVTTDDLTGCMTAVNYVRVSQDLTLRSSEDGQRWTSGNQTCECLGFAIVAGFSPDKKRICLLTPISHSILDTDRKDGTCIVLVVQSVDADGRYDTAWVQSELDTLVDKKARKTVFRRKLHVL